MINFKIMQEEKNLKIKKFFQVALENHQKNNFKTAEKLYMKVLKIEPNHLNSIFLLGSLFVQTQNFNSAKQLLEKSS